MNTHAEVYVHPKSVREGIIRPLHTPGSIYYTRSIISAFVLIRDLNFLGSNGSKQSINDASQYVVVLTHLHEGKGMDVAKVQIKSEIGKVFRHFI